MSSDSPPTENPAKQRLDIPLLSNSVTQWTKLLAEGRENIENKPFTLQVEGKLTRMVGMTLEAEGCESAIGSRCLVEGVDKQCIETEVVGFSGDKLYLMPTEGLHGILPNARVIPTSDSYRVPVGIELLGRVIDGAGNPLDDKGPLENTRQAPLTGKIMNPLSREPITTHLDVGVRAINAMLTVGRGQRMGLFAGSGVGKSVLLGMMTKFTDADVIVVGLIGERGREVKEFIENILGDEGMARSVVVAVPADQSPVMRLHGAQVATSIAEDFRDQGKHVLLLMDSLTRFAQAQREIALAIGEPPATKGYPPSVFAKLPGLVERAGNGVSGGGSITAFYTVLTEGDDQQDPIADAARAILDGHVVLSRELAEKGHYPAIDIEASISRVMTEVVDESHIELAQRFKQIYSVYQQNRDLINVGAYTYGTEPAIDEAIELQPSLMSFLQQGMNEAMSFEGCLHDLEMVMTQPTQSQQVINTQQPAVTPGMASANVYKQ
ncbi:flagellar protein export ATPase FliI [sulfur-oxidizing endosymbiont of Gigantopelta aegis]|uniref:flagellar protein export ATPase FliI n=1 Tax=sulfur-oxidizing endosymbiont of Gigantopelta aegis TaxID=2794934 RepID=UPI0018DDEEAF|nr:flagellar protein export ATPase FliI [sulfur-oxidizing endosymbiont of Gigantopelta aegis]